MSDIPTHHIVYGTTIDYITGDKIVDTDDERYRQKLARLLVEQRGYDKSELEMRLQVESLFSANFVVSTIDIVVSVKNRRLIALRYGPGSLVTRERSALAAARVLEPAYQIPYVVVTNGEDAEFLETGTGKVLAYGLAAIPNRQEASTLLAEAGFTPLPEGRQREMELRILNAFDKQICCI